MKKFRVKIEPDVLADIHEIIYGSNNTVEVLAIISTNRNPKIWDEKAGKHE